MIDSTSHWLRKVPAGATPTGATPAPEKQTPVPSSWTRRHPLGSLLLSRLGAGLFTLLIVSILVFAATQLLPGNAARAVLGFSATPARLHALEVQLQLNRSWLAQYWSWLSGLVQGRLGMSLANSVPVWQLAGPRLLNSAVLVAISGTLTVVIGVTLGAVSAARRNTWLDEVLAVSALAFAAMPEFVVAIALVIVFSVEVFHILPAVSMVPPGQNALSNPSLLVLPVASLVLVAFPYVMRMTRAATLEALESPYAEMARLKGVPQRRVLFVHALPNALAPTVQVIGLTFLRLAGGIVLVEYVFAFPGIGQGLVNAVSDRDIPAIQFIVVVLAAFYVVMNIVTDVVALLASPRRRPSR